MRVEPKIKAKKANGNLTEEKNTRLKWAIVFVFIGVYYFFLKCVF